MQCTDVEHGEIHVFLEQCVDTVIRELTLSHNAMFVSTVSTGVHVDI